MLSPFPRPDVPFRETALRAWKFLLVLGALISPASAEPILQGIGTLGGMATQPAGMNDLGQVAGTLTGT